MKAVSDEDADLPRLESIEVCHYARSNFSADVYGARGAHNAHAETVDPPTRGWLGNPFKAEDDSLAERKRVIAAWTAYFLDRVQEDPAFREAVQDLRGQRVACWCRGVSQDRTPDRWCHLDVVAAWLSGDLTPVYQYLRGDHA